MDLYESMVDYKPHPEDITVCHTPVGNIQRTVVCAANRYDDIIICGARHYDDIMCGQIDSMSEDNRKKIKACRGKGEEFYQQGFIDQWGNFINRDDAAIIARASGQILRNPDFTGMLFSEWLY